MPGHHNLHRRNARPENPFADALAAAFPNAFGKQQQQQQQASTVVSVVYVTASPTFTGAIGGFKTLGVAIDTSQAQPTTTSSPKPKSSATKLDVDTSSSISSKSTKAKTTLATSTLPSAITAPSTTVGTSIALLAASGSVTSNTASKASATSTSAASTESSAPTSSGMSTGGKVGLAIGILLLIGAVLALVLFCFKKRKDAAKKELVENQENEKFASVGRAASTRTTATAPRLSLRPITQFLPNLAEKRQSRGNALMTVPEPQREKPNAWDRPMTGQSNNRENPFGNHAETIDSTNARGPEVVQDMTPAGEVMTAATIGTAAVAPIGLKRGASKRENAPQHLDFTKSGPFMGPPSPVGTEFSVSSEATGSPTQTGTGAAIAAAGGPANSAVHRVQLDFKPSMEDELELRAGQLIRVLHEYDDGWALCIRLDRSQQGVVPRTCLSTRPVKPRPMQNGPRGPPPGMRAQQPRPMSPAGPNGQQQRQMAPAGLQIRPMTPTGQHPRPMSPAGQQRPMTPNGQQRSMTPNGQQQRPMTPNSQGRARSNSAAQMQAPRIAQPGPSPMNPVAQYDGAGSPPQGPPMLVGRKPVPGQAL